jgi:hypothetical protein
VDPELDFSASESSDFEEIIHVRETGEDAIMEERTEKQDFDQLNQAEHEEEVIH